MLFFHFHLPRRWIRNSLCVFQKFCSESFVSLMSFLFVTLSIQGSQLFLLQSESFFSCCVFTKHWSFKGANPFANTKEIDEKLFMCFQNFCSYRDLIFYGFNFSVSWIIAIGNYVFLISYLRYRILSFIRIEVLKSYTSRRTCFSVG